jgi:hypothetical protein
LGYVCIGEEGGEELADGIVHSVKDHDDQDASSSAVIDQVKDYHGAKTSYIKKSRPNSKMGSETKQK